MGASLAPTILGDVVCGRGDYPAARRLLEESLAISRQLGDWERIAHSLNILGKVTDEQGDYRVARALHIEGLEIMRKLGDRWGVAWTLEGLAVAFAQAVPSRAACIWGHVERLREEIGAPLPPSEQLRYSRYVTVARAAIGDSAAFDLAWRKGRAITLEQAIECAAEQTGCVTHGSRSGDSRCITCRVTAGKSFATNRAIRARLTVGFEIYRTSATVLIGYRRKNPPTFPSLIASVKSKSSPPSLNSTFQT
jgi:hypothetical protein